MNGVACMYKHHVQIVLNVFTLQCLNGLNVSIAPKFLLPKTL